MTNNELEEKYICCSCVAESYLSNEIRRFGLLSSCDYCGNQETSYSIVILADRVEQAFQDHFIRTSENPDSLQERMLADRESNYEWDREGEPVVDAIENAAKIPREAASDIQEILESKYSYPEAALLGDECEFSGDSYYEEKAINDSSWLVKWNDFENSLKTEARFFNRNAEELLASIFNNVDSLSTSNGKFLVVDAGPDTEITHLFRARVFQEEDSMKEALARPDVFMGPPPAKMAGPGRMNPAGISVFYGATVQETALAEVRPPAGSKVVVAKFNIIRPLKLLDLTAFEHLHETGSIFDPELRHRLERSAFQKSLGMRMSKVVLPNDVALEYLITQATADFLATTNIPTLDGVVFSSSQALHGRNVVLFHKSSAVEEMVFPHGSEFEVRTKIETSDGIEDSFVVFEHIPKELNNHDRVLKSIDTFDFLENKNKAPIEFTLRVDSEVLDVYEIKSISYYAFSFPVVRHQISKSIIDDF